MTRFKQDQLQTDMTEEIVVKICLLIIKFFSSHNQFRAVQITLFQFHSGFSTRNQFIIKCAWCILFPITEITLFAFHVIATNTHFHLVSFQFSLKKKSWKSELKSKIIQKISHNLCIIYIHFLKIGISEICKLPCSYPSKLKFPVTVRSPLSTYHTELFASMNLCRVSAPKKG